FVSGYDRLATHEPLPPRLEMTPAPMHLFVATAFDNLLSATTRGGELAASATPTSWWRIDGSVTALGVTPHLSAQSHDTAGGAFDGNAPQTQWQLRSQLTARRTAFDLVLAHAGALR